jgi:hypothetical protein
LLSRVYPSSGDLFTKKYDIRLVMSPTDAAVRYPKILTDLNFGIAVRCELDVFASDKLWIQAGDTGVQLVSGENVPAAGAQNPI